MGEVGGISSNGNRFIGLATGIDTDEQVKKMLTGEQAKIDRVKQQEQYNQWKQEAYVDITKDLKELKSSFLDILSPNETNLIKSSAYISTKATINNSIENTGIVDVTSLAGAKTGNYKIKVQQMATSAKAEININSKNINDQLEFNITVDDSKQLPIKVKIPKTKDGKNIDKKEFASQLKKYEVDIDGKKKKLSEYVNVDYSELTEKITISSKSTGKNSTIKVEGTSIKNSAITTTVTNGQNAIAYIKEPGQMELTKVERKENNFIIDNIKYDITGQDINKEISINVKNDTSDSVKKMKKFVEKYNAILEKVNGKLSEKKNYKFKPLTEAQRKDMKEDEIKKWDKKAKEGILRNDMDLTNMLSQMRNAFFDKVKEANISPSEIGITTSRDYTKKGKLEFDEEKFAKALENNSDKIQEMFTKTSSKSNPKDKYNEEGIFCRINNILDRYVGREGVIIKKAGYEGSRWAKDNALSKNIVMQEKKIKELERMMFDKQERYYQMFARLETAMNKMNAQANWFASQMAQ